MLWQAVQRRASCFDASSNGSDARDQSFHAEKEFAITGSVPADPLVLTVTPGKSSCAVDKGETITATWEATGGTGPYEFNYHWNLFVTGSDEGEYIYGGSGKEEKSASFKPLYGQRCELFVEVVDSLDRRQFQRTSIALTGAPDLEVFTLSLNLDKDTVAIDKGERIRGDWEAQGGVGPYTYHYSWELFDVPDGEGKTVSSAYQTKTRSDTLKPAFGRKGTLQVTAKDQRGVEISETKTFALTGDPATAPLQLEISLDKDTLNIGETIAVTCTASGGVAPYAFEYSWRVKPSQDGDFQTVESEYETTSSTSSFTPLYGVAGRLEVGLKDSRGREVSKTIDFGIKGQEEVEELVLSIELDKASVAVGETIKAKWEASGGMAPYTYSTGWRVWEKSQDSVAWIRTVKNTVETTAREDEFEPAYGFKCEFYVTVTDSRGVRLWQQEIFDITGAPDVQPIGITVSLDKTIVDAGNKEEITASWEASGGNGGYEYYVSWAVSEYPGDLFYNVVRSLEQTTNTSDTLTVTYGQKGYVDIGVKDKDGRISYDSQYFEISGSQAAEQPLEARIRLTSNTIKAFSEQTATVEVLGAKGPYTCAFEWFTGLNPERQLFSAQDASASTSSTVKVPNQANSALVKVIVRDAAGRIGEFTEGFRIIVDVTRGDANDDGRINTADMGAIVEHLINKTPPKSMDNANANKEGQVDVDDLLAIINMLAGD